jgi:colanic acid biosynthesis glycosyl transferase WcaI
MKLLLVTLNFAPELTGIGRYNREMVEWLVQRGHEVQVVCAPPYYPSWRVASGFHASRYQASSSEGVRIVRCPIYVPQKPSGVRRLLHLASFAVTSAPVILWKAVRWKPDCIFLTMPPMACAPAVWLAGRVSGARRWMHVQDLEVDAAFDLGLIRGKTARALLLALERRLMRSFERVSTISRRMHDRLIAKGLDAGRTMLFPNWTDLEAIRPLDAPSVYRAELGLSAHTCVCLYSGTLGLKQGIDLLVEAFVRLPEELDVALVICGDGPARAGLESQQSENRRLHLLPLQPADRLNELLGLGDIQVLPQRSEAQDLVMPSKLANMLASGRAVVACASPGSEMAEVLNGVAVVVPPNDVLALRDALSNLISAPSVRRNLGALGRHRAESLWERVRILQKAFTTAIAD